MPNRKMGVVTRVTGSTGPTPNRSDRSASEQMRRAAASVVLNIAEGAAHYSPGRKVYHYQIARGSASECIAALTAFARRSAAIEAQHARATANMICKMLTRLIKVHSNRP